MEKNKSNLLSPQSISAPCDLNNLDTWNSKEIERLNNDSEKAVISLVADNLDDFVKFPSRAILMWKGCNRQPEKGKKMKYHQYPKELVQTLKESGVPSLDGRPNGPAVAAFLYAGGVRPKRYGSNNQWAIHHVYSGKFPYIGRTETLHAVKHGDHFTNSAGLIAVHPIADQMCDEYPFFAWYLRALAYKKFGYDPDGVFRMRIPERSKIS